MEELEEFAIFGSILLEVYYWKYITGSMYHKSKNLGGPGRKCPGEVRTPVRTKAFYFHLQNIYRQHFPVNSLHLLIVSVWNNNS